MELNSDAAIVWQCGFFAINVTIATTWGIIILLVGSAALISRKLVSDIHISKWQNFLEITVLEIKKQIEEIGVRNAEKYMSFLGTLFLFIATATLLSVFPYYRIPTGSLSTTAALAISVFTSVIVFGIREKGLKNYLKSYLEPMAVMLPFNLISEFSRTMALAIRLFGNMMSGEMIASIFLTLTPLFFPMIMKAFGLLIGMIQAYIFTVLATVYIAAATQLKEGEKHG